MCAQQKPTVFLHVLPVKNDCHPATPNKYRASMHWGVASIAARAGVYAMVGSLTDDQIRQQFR